MPSASSVVRTVKSIFPACRLFREDAAPSSSPPNNNNNNNNNNHPPLQDFTNMVIFCRKSPEPFTFRTPVEADFLDTQSRRHHLFPKHEIASGHFDGRKKGGEHDDDNEVGILKRGQTQVLEKWQKQSAVGHWWLMRTVLPHAVWENW